MDSSKVVVVKSPLEGSFGVEGRRKGVAQPSLRERQEKSGGVEVGEGVELGVLVKLEVILAVKVGEGARVVKVVVVGVRVAPLLSETAPCVESSSDEGDGEYV